jgi:hypothetical protein
MRSDHSHRRDKDGTRYWCPTADAGGCHWNQPIIQAIELERRGAAMRKAAEECDAQAIVLRMS